MPNNRSIYNLVARAFSWASLMLFAGGIAFTQTKEFVRINGRVVAIENMGLDGASVEPEQNNEVPDNVNISAPFSAVIRIRNTGTTTWDFANYRLQPQGATAADFGISGEINFPSGTTSVAPNGIVAFAVNGTSRGTVCANCPFQFKMAKAGAAFGNTATYTINIVGSVTVGVTPASQVTLNRLQTTSYTATVTNAANNTLNWANPAQGTFQLGTTQSGGTNVYTAPSTVASTSSQTGTVCSAATPTACQSIGVTLSRISLGFSGSTSGVQFNGAPRAFTASLAGLSSVGGNRQVSVAWSSTIAGTAGTVNGQGTTQVLTVDGGSGPTGNATFTYTPPICATGQNCGTPTITMTLSSVLDPTQTTVVQFTVSQPQQTISAATPTLQSGTEATFGFTVADPVATTRISHAEFLLSANTGTNQFVTGQNCRFRTYYTGGAHYIQLDDANGSGSYPQAGKVIGSVGAGLSNGACEILTAQSTATPATPTTQWVYSLKIKNLNMSGARYLRGMTSSNNGSSAPFVWSYLGAAWTVPAAPVFTITNSQNANPPVLYQGFTVTLNMQVTNICGTCKAKFKLAQALDGGMTHSNPAPAPYQAQAIYSAGNSGEDRDIIVRLIVYNTAADWSSENENGIYWEKPGGYTVRVLSSTSSLPELDGFTNPFTNSTSNPLPINSTVTANGSASTFLAYSMKNFPYPATQCVFGGACTPVNQLYFNINRNFSESGMAQDRASGCRLRLHVYSGSQPPSFYFWLMDDAGQYESGFNFFPAYGWSGSVSNSQCTVNINPSLGAYAGTPYSDNTFLGIGLSFVFKTPFVGQRHVFMMGNRNNGDWTGWQYRGKLTLQ